jgi:NADH-quinone oxidoreductase subunit M
MLVPLALVVLWLGIYPSSATDDFTSSVSALVQAHTAALVKPVVMVMK